MTRSAYLLSLCIVTAWSATNALADDAIGYNSDIRPILADNCFSCHGPDSASRKAGLRLDKREAAIEAGAIDPGKPDASELIARIMSTDADEQMPPPSTHKKLTDAQKNLLKRWIATGAEYQPHWAFIAPRTVAVPEVKNKAWPRSPVDNFILAKLESLGLQPAPEADRRTLARRACLDITGLPPDPADVEAFVNDSAPDAYERYIDRLMARPEWGEHRARYWLDAARYADTHGIHMDNFRENWAYREWVINAFNRNLPFDQFTIEQLAGDLLPNRTLDQLVGSGFNRCNITTSEGGAIDEEYLVLYTRDRTETVSQVWLGMTAGCAVCHDHKFDPLTQREFYGMAAFFNNTTQRAMDGNIKDTPPVVDVPLTEDRGTWEKLSGELAATQQQIDARRAVARTDFDAWFAKATPATIEAKLVNDGLSFYAPLGEGDGKVLGVSVKGQPRPVSLEQDPAWDAGVTAAKAYKTAPSPVVELKDVGDFERDQAFTCSAWVKVPQEGVNGAMVARMDDTHDYRGWDMWLDQGRPSTHIIHRWPKNALKVTSKTALRPNTWQHITISYDGTGRAKGVQIYIDGVPQEVQHDANSLTRTIRTKVPFKLAQRDKDSRVSDMALQEVRLYNRVLDSAEVVDLAGASRAAYLLTKPVDGRSASEVEELYSWWVMSFDDASKSLVARKHELEATEIAIKSRATVAHVMNERKEMPIAFILDRGEYTKRGEKVKAITPEFLPSFPDGEPLNRLGYAHWLLRPEHPLTARVTVNRFWQELFGTGLVKTSGEFGVAGELPSHPELLDWLAIDFREHGWDVKRFVRELMLSSTYRQSAVVSPEKQEKDPQNRLLSRGPRFRMDAEMVRDYALAASGMLVRKIGGPSVKPYQPEGVWDAVAMRESNTRVYQQDSGESLYRRSMYTFWKRSAPPASMEIFNAPTREVCTVRRERTNTPLQALVVLNDPQEIEAARHLAERTLRDAGTSDAVRFDFVANRLLARPLATDELPVVEKSLSDLLAYYRAHGDDAKALIAVGESKPDATLDPATLAAWTMLNNELFNLDEALNK